MYGSLQELCELEEKSRETVLEDRAGGRLQGSGDHGGVSFEQMRAMYQAMKDADARYVKN